jgi:HAD superfamily hydrolase (TIGR01509 family)
MDDRAEVRGLILDFDGLVIDTESAVYHGWREVYEHHGHALPLETYVACVGSSTEHSYDPAAALDRLVGERLDWETLHAQKQRRIHALLEGEGPLPGVTELLDAAEGRGLPCAIASSSPHSWVDRWLDRLDLAGRFHSVWCRDDVPLPKPSPDLFLRAAAALGLGPAEVLVFEDSQNGLRAALAAGMRCVVVPNPVTAGSDFQGAWALLGSLADVDGALASASVGRARSEAPPR